MTGASERGLLPRRVALVSVHTSPLAQPGTGDGGGLNVYVRETATRLARSGVDVDVFTRRADADTPDEVTLADGVRVHTIEAGPAAPIAKNDVANYLCAFVLAMRGHRLAGVHDLMHTHYWLAGWVGRRVAPRWAIPQVHTFHTLGVMKNATLAPQDRPEPPIRLAAEKRIARDADRLLVLTCGEARLLHRAYGISGDRMAVVPAGVDLARFTPAATPRQDGRDPLLLFVGRLQPLKGPDVAVEILAEVRRTHPTARLRIIGGLSGPSSRATGPDGLMRRARELGIADAVTVEPAIPQDELAKRYREADVVLVPSRSETFGLVALEAQASGVPVVAARVPGLEAVVGSGGHLVEGHDPADHARAVRMYLDDTTRAHAAGRAGRRTAERCSWDVTADRLLGAYATVLDGHSERAPASQRRPRLAG